MSDYGDFRQAFRESRIGSRTNNSFFFFLSFFCFAGRPFPEASPLQGFHVQVTERKGDLVRFDLDFGDYLIRGVQANLSKEFPIVRLPASISKSGRGRPEIDFADTELKGRVLDQVNALISNNSVIPAKAGIQNKRNWIPALVQRPRTQGASETRRASAGMTKIRVVLLEKLEHRRGIRVGTGELWFDEKIAVKFSLMESKWSADPKNWWIAYPSAWVGRDKRWDDLFVIKNRALKKEAADLVRKTFLERYPVED